jgi:hypothetical protein
VLETPPLLPFSVVQSGGWTWGRDGEAISKIEQGRRHIRNPFFHSCHALPISMYSWSFHFMNITRVITVNLYSTIMPRLLSKLALRSGLVAVHVVIVKHKKKQKKKQKKHGDVYAKTSTWPKSNIDIKTSIIMPVSL